MGATILQCVTKHVAQVNALILESRHLVWTELLDRGQTSSESQLIKFHQKEKSDCEFYDGQQCSAWERESRSGREHPVTGWRHKGTLPVLWGAIPAHLGPPTYQTRARECEKGIRREAGQREGWEGGSDYHHFLRAPGSRLEG